MSERLSVDDPVQRAEALLWMHRQPQEVTMLETWVDTNSEQSIDDFQHTQEQLSHNATHDRGQELYERSLHAQLVGDKENRDLAPVNSSLVEPESTDDKPLQAAMREVIGSKLQALLGRARELYKTRISSKDETQIAGDHDSINKIIKQSLDKETQLEALPEAAAPAVIKPASQLVAYTEDVDTSRSETDNQNSLIKVGSAELIKYGEDSTLINNDLCVYGVFDGMGSGDSPKIASQLASHVISRSLSKEPIPNTIEEALEQLGRAFTRARREVIKRGGGNITTATVGRMVNLNGEAYWVFANAGDSRMFRYNSNDKSLVSGGGYQSLTTDQSRGRFLLNGLGDDDKWMFAEDEFGYIKLQDGDRIMICSDGITGDFEHQFLSQEEMRSGFTAGYTEKHPDLAAKKFVELSKKSDDKSVLVLDISFRQPASSAVIQEQPRYLPVLAKTFLPVTIGPTGAELLRSENEDEILRLWDLALAHEAYTNAAAARDRATFTPRLTDKRVEEARYRYETARANVQATIIDRFKQRGLEKDLVVDFMKRDDLAEADSLAASFRWEAEHRQVKLQKFYDWWARQGGGDKFFSRKRIIGSLNKSAAMAAIGIPAGIVAAAAGAIVAGPVLGGVTAAALARGVTRGLVRGKLTKEANSASVAVKQYGYRQERQRAAILAAYDKEVSGRQEQLFTGIKQVTAAFADGTERSVRRNRIRLISSMAIGALAGWGFASLGEIIHDALWGTTPGLAKAPSVVPRLARPSLPHSPTTTPPPSLPPSTPVPAVPTVPPITVPPAVTAPQVHTVDLFAGDNPWEVAEEELERRGMANPTNSQIWSLDKRILKLNNISVSGSYHLAVGSPLEVPNN